LPSETMIWQPEFTDKTLSRKPGAVQIQFPHGSDWSEVLRLTDIVTEKVSSGRAAGGYHHRHTGYTWSVSVN
ncbi:UNVERIFIED_CONTAM: hypothetical protein PO322_24900, partial [Escherichia coli]